MMRKKFIGDARFLRPTAEQVGTSFDGGSAVREYDVPPAAKRVVEVVRDVNEISAYLGIFLFLSFGLCFTT
jgi:hypothetical protein